VRTADTRDEQALTAYLDAHPNAERKDVYAPFMAGYIARERLAVQAVGSDDPDMAIVNDILRRTREDADYWFKESMRSGRIARENQRLVRVWLDGFAEQRRSERAAGHEIAAWRRVAEQRKQIRALHATIAELRARKESPDE